MRKNSRGQAMIGSVLFVLIAAMLLSAGLVGPGVRNNKEVTGFKNSLRSFHLAESGVEDVLYRLREGLNVDIEEVLTIDGYSVTSNIETTGDTKTITTLGIFNDFFRKINSKVTAGTGVAFNYAVQIGQGSLVLQNNAGIIGNVYSNGSIYGSNGAFITGSAIAANSSSLVADQENDVPSTPTNEIVFRNSSATQDFAQSFTVSSSTPINKVDFYIKKVGNPSNASVYIVDDSGGSPGTNVLANGSLNAALVTDDLGWVATTFDINPSLTPGSTYWLVIDNGSVHGSKYYVLGANDDGYGSGVAKIGEHEDDWSDPSPTTLDSYFKLYLGGILSSIDNVDIGEEGVGNAHAHTVTNSSIEGELYCQVGSGNNKSCDTSQTDPAPQNFPVSDANIEAWKADAEAGDLWSGDYLASSSVSYLGPIKIDGNLNVSNNRNLVIQGTVWVTGDILFDNNVIVSLDASYGENSGIIITDGSVTISNNGTFEDSGVEGSYIMVLSTSDAEPAIDLKNNAGTVILNAQKGTIYFSNNAAAKAIVANKLVLEPNAVIVYEQGLVNQNFVSGPSGGWNILNWQEVE